MVTTITANAATTTGSLTFSNTPLLRPEGESEPAISIGANGAMAITGLQWLFDPSFFGTHLWTGPFGSTPTFQGLVDAALQKPGKQVFGSGDADVDLGSTGTLHASTLIFLGNPTFNNFKLGVSAIACPNGTSSSFNINDPFTHNIYDVFTAGETGFLKGRTFTPNHIYVSRSTNGGVSWTANLVFQAPPGSSLANIFPSLAVEPTNGKLYAVWSDAHTTWFSASSDQGAHWSNAVAVNTAPANTAVLPWIAAYNGTVDVVYYGTTAASKDDSSAVWNVYLAQTKDDGANFVQSLVSNTPNHVDVICTNGTGCASGTRNLLDLFEIAINPINGRAAIIYTDDTLTFDSANNPLPQIVLAQQN